MGSPVENSNPSKQASKGLKWLASTGFLATVVSVLLAAFSGFGTRWGWWDFREGLGYFRDSVFVAGVALLLSLAAVAWSAVARNKTENVKSTVGLLIALVIVGNFLGWLHHAKGVPPIHDITTDTKNPPVFEAVLPLRKDALNPPEYGGPEIAAQQQKAYPDIRPLLLSLPPDKVWQACRNTAVKMGWVLDAADEAKGRIEATDTTFWFGFKDDIVVRITPQAQGCLVDVRSVSRVGKGDVGTNAERIRRYLKEVRVSLGA